MHKCELMIIKYSREDHNSPHNLPKKGRKVQEFDFCTKVFLLFLTFHSVKDFIHVSQADIEKYSISSSDVSNIYL